MEVHCRVEGGSRIMDRQVLRVWRGAAWERRGLCCRRYACLRSTRTVRSTDRKFVAEAGYPCGRVATQSQVTKVANAQMNQSGDDGQGLKASDAMQWPSERQLEMESIPAAVGRGTISRPRVFQSLSLDSQRTTAPYSQFSQFESNSG